MLVGVDTRPHVQQRPSASMTTTRPMEPKKPSTNAPAGIGTKVRYLNQFRGDFRGAQTGDLPASVRRLLSRKQRAASC
jgi:hypothetical protein